MFSLYLPLTQWRCSGGPQRDRGFAKVLQPKQGLALTRPECNPRNLPLVIFAVSITLGGWATGLTPRLNVRANLPPTAEYPQSTVVYPLLVQKAQVEP